MTGSWKNILKSLGYRVVVGMGNVPKLRFPEFRGEWEKKKLKEVGNSVIGLTYSPNDISDKGYLVLRACNIKDNQLSFDDQIFVNMKIPEKLTVQKGDILICARSGSQHLIGKNAYIDKDYPCYTFGAFMCVFRCERSAYVFQGFQTSRIKKQILVNQGARINQITTANINAFSMYFPSIDEQTKIANFLNLFDARIEKQAEKVAALEEYKKGLMQKLFSQEIRFKDDDGKDYPEWERKKAKEIFYNISDKNHNGDLVALSVTQDRGTVLREDMAIDIKYDKVNLKNYKRVKENNFIISLRSFQGGIDRSNHNGLVSPAYTVFDISEPEKHEPRYYGYLLKSKRFINKLNTLIYGIRDGKAIGFNDFSELPIHYPRKFEQTKIANFLTLFDLKIEKEKEKLEALREQKKGLLQQMFI